MVCLGTLGLGGHSNVEVALRAEGLVARILKVRRGWGSGYGLVLVEVLICVIITVEP